MQEYDFNYVHIAGTANVVADGISRLNVLTGEQVLLDAKGKQDAMRACHGPLKGHHGVKRTVDLLRKAGHHWDNMFRDVGQFIRSCTVCTKMKNQKDSFVVAMGTTMASKPFEIVSMDLVGPLTEDASRNKYILVMVDHFSRYALLKALPNKEAKTVAFGIFETLGLFGVLPQVIRTDHGSEFIAKLTCEMLALLGEHETTVTDHPESNGMVERRVQEVMKHLRCIAAERELSSHWSVVLPMVQRIVNVVDNSTTGFSPMHVLFGMYGQEREHFVRSDYFSSPALASDLVRELLNSQHLVSLKVKENQARYLKKYLRDSPADPTSLAVGDVVLANHRGETPPSKLAPRFRGPYVVLERTGTNRYSVRHLVTEQVIDVHLADLKPFRGTREQANKAAVMDVQINKEYLVDSIVDHKFLRRPHCRVDNVRFRIRWCGWGANHDSWVKFDVVKELEALDRYVQDYPALSPLVDAWMSSGRRAVSQPALALGGSGVAATTGLSPSVANITATCQLNPEGALSSPKGRGSWRRHRDWRRYLYVAA
jgi:hypothetical protein